MIFVNEYDNPYRKPFVCPTDKSCCLYNKKGCCTMDTPFDDCDDYMYYNDICDERK